MYLSKVSLRQFRSYQGAQFSFDKSLTIITGDNGSGKTNLLEAIYVLLQGSSFRVADKDMIHSGSSWWRLDGEIDGVVRQVRYQLGHHPPKQLIAHEAAKRFMYQDRLPVVLFEPTDLQLVHGSPSRRRETLDTMLISLSPSYKTALSKYERALKQRNNALKHHTPNLIDQLFSWDVLLSEYGVEIIGARHSLISELNTLLSGYYTAIAGDIQELMMVYKNDLGQAPSSSKFITSLHHTLPLDKQQGTTSTGPHRDDIDFILRGSDARQSASRGEVRTTILALKMAYAQLLEKAHGQKPLILLDDVFSELDQHRQYNLLNISLGHQVVVTHTRSLEKIYEIKL